jgi:hypothetical protein
MVRISGFMFWYRVVFRNYRVQGLGLGFILKGVTLQGAAFGNEGSSVYVLGIRFQCSRSWV